MFGEKKCQFSIFICQFNSYLCLVEAKLGYGSEKLQINLLIRSPCTNFVTKKCKVYFHSLIKLRKNDLFTRS